MISSGNESSVQYAQLAMKLQVFALITTLLAAPASADSALCRMYHIGKILLHPEATHRVAPDLQGIFEGRLLYPSGKDCLPSDQVLIMGLHDDERPEVLAYLNGHTPNLSIHKLDGITYIAAKYFTGGNLQVLRIFRRDPTGWAALAGPTPSSNMRSININGNIIEVRNIIIQHDQQRVETERYMVVDDRIRDVSSVQNPVQLN